MRVNEGFHGSGPAWREKARRLAGKNLSPLGGTPASRISCAGFAAQAVRQKIEPAKQAAARRRYGKLA